MHFAQGGRLALVQLSRPCGVGSNAEWAGRARPAWLARGPARRQRNRPHASRTLAARHHAELVSATRAEDESFWSDALNGQVFMGDEAFVQRMQVQAEPRRLAAKAIPKAQRAVAGTWDQHLKACNSDRNAAL